MLEFDNSTHTYTKDGKTLISVTQLMQRMGLSPDYSMVDPETLNAKAERGTVIHEEINKWCVEGEKGFTDECAQFADYIKSNACAVLESERMVSKGSIAGTLDLKLVQDGKIILADIKTTSVLHKEAVSWQLSLYDYLQGWGADVYQAFWFSKDGLKVVEIPKKPKAEVERLVKCYEEDKEFKMFLPIEERELQELIEAEELIKRIEYQKKLAEESAKEMREKLLKAMEENGITKWEDERVILTRIESVTKKTVDSKKLKEKYPEAYEDCLKDQITKAYARITLKEEK